MNILPKKRLAKLVAYLPALELELVEFEEKISTSNRLFFLWHVRTRENIARVRKDEAAAAEEESKRKQKILLAEKEARIELLRTQARIRYPKNESTKTEETADSKEGNTVSLIGNNGHVNLFYELEDNNIVSDQKNEEHEKEAKAEREKEEMKIGYLTYLGQDTCELTGQVSWYNLPPRSRLDTPPPSSNSSNVEKSESIPPSTDTLTLVYESVLPKSSKVSKKSAKRKKEKLILKLAKKILKKKKKKKKRRRRSSSSSSSTSSQNGCRETQTKDIEKMRAERLKREQVERARAAAHLARLRGDAPAPEPTTDTLTYRAKYNSQFNPELARQNYPRE